MKMVTRIAMDNMKYHKSRNILTGVAIFLTTLLLLVVPMVARGIVAIQFAEINAYYPTWHARYGGVDNETVKELSTCGDIEKWGLRCDVGELSKDRASCELKNTQYIYMMFFDEAGAKMSRLGLSEGRLPEQENEIVVSSRVLAIYGQEDKKTGDRITLPVRLYRNGILDYTVDEEFTISGFVNDPADENAGMTVLVSEDFVKSKISEEELSYRFLFQVRGKENSTVDDIEEHIKSIAGEFGIDENDIKINDEYLDANYIDPSMMSIVAGIMAVIMFAGVITIYSIYYVSLPQRVQEFGRIKAIGATRRQMKQIVLREGLLVTMLAVPVGLAVGTLLSFIILTVLKGQSFGGYGLKVDLLGWWVYPIAVAVTFIAVYISLLKPMRVLSGVSEVEAMRYHDTNRGRAEKKGHREISVGRIVINNLMGNRKKSLMTICSMSITGVFFMVMATVLSGAKPEDIANQAAVGQYMIRINAEEGNVEHPEWAWSDVVKHNPLDEDFKNELLSLEGVKRVDTFTALDVTGEIFGEYGERITGIPEEYASELEASIVEGKGTYKDLKSGDKIMVDRVLLKWYPDLQAGSVVTLTVHDGERSFEKNMEVIAIVDMRYGIYAGGQIIMANEAVEKLCKYNHIYHYSVIAEENYIKELENAIEGLIGGNEQAELLMLDTWQLRYEIAKGSLVSARAGCYAMLGILYVISMMNLMNTMVNSVHVRRKDIGMLQAIGMSDKQLMKMLQLEGMFYTVGTLLISVGGGSLLGYPVFLMMKEKKIFCAIYYHYPVMIAVILSVTLILLQVILAAGLARSVKRESLIDRVRFSE